MNHNHRQGDIFVSRRPQYRDYAPHRRVPDFYSASEDDGDDSGSEAGYRRRRRVRSRSSDGYSSDRGASHDESFVIEERDSSRMPSSSWGYQANRNSKDYVLMSLDLSPLVA